MVSGHNSVERFATLVSKEQFEDVHSSYIVAISRPLIVLGRAAEARKELLEVLRIARVEAAKG